MQHDMAVADADADAPIPAFAVSKGGVVLKHIFLNAPPSSPNPGGEEEEGEDPPVTVGRHPDCHVLVDHPSVSRFHIHLRARRRQRRITVTDLRSGENTCRSALCTRNQRLCEPLRVRFNCSICDLGGKQTRVFTFDSS
jgi:hypothetical protein